MDTETYHKFVVFAGNNPELYDQLCADLRTMRSLGFHKYSVRTCWAVLRFRFDSTRGPEEAYNLNDAYQSYYSRLIIAREEDLRGFFETRERQGELTDEDVYARLNDDFHTGYMPAVPVEVNVTVTPALIEPKFNDRPKEWTDEELEEMF